MSIRILKQGMLASLQAQPRKSHRHQGIGSGGAMDPFASQVANFLLGNDAHTTVIEMHFPAPELLFEENALVCLAGADFDACVNDVAVTGWKPFFVPKGSVMKCRKPVWGSKLYLAVRGGWEAEAWLDSTSTHLKLAAGGFHGRALQKGDVVAFAKDLTVQEEPVPGIKNSLFSLDEVYPAENRIRCTCGPEWNCLSEQSKQVFEMQRFTVGSQSDRMGYRLAAAALQTCHPVEMISSAVDTGIIQLLPDGNLIVLMADHPTTGGYPRIASVTRADIPALAQCNPGHRIGFTIVTPQQAEEALISREQSMQKIKDTCFQQYQNKNNH